MSHLFFLSEGRLLQICFEDGGQDLSDIISWVNFKLAAALAVNLF